MEGFIRSLVNHLATLSENYKRTPPPSPGMDGERVDFSSCFTAGWRRERRLRLVVVNPPPFETHPPPYFCIIPPVFVPSSFAPSWGGGRRLCPLLRKGKEELFPERGTLSVSFFSLIPSSAFPPLTPCLLREGRRGDVSASRSNFSGCHFYVRHGDRPLAEGGRGVARAAPSPRSLSTQGDGGRRRRRRSKGRATL